MKNKRIFDSGVYTYFLSLGISVLVLLFCSFITAAILHSGEDPTRNIGVATLSSLIVSSALSAFAVSRINRDGGIKTCALVAFGVVLLMLITGAIASGGRLSGSSFMNYGCYLAVFLLTGYIGRIKKKRRGHK